MAPYPTGITFPLRSEKYWFRSIILASIGYGINFALYLVCVNLLICRTTGPKDPAQSAPIRTHRQWNILSLVYITFMFTCCTISIVVECVIGETAYIGPPSLSPQGSAKYLFDQTFLHATVLRAAYISFFLCYWGANGLLAWRCLIIYKYSLHGKVACAWTPKWVLWMILPGILVIASAATGIIWLLQAVAPHCLPKDIRLLKWPLIWASVAVALEWILTGMIVVRLLMHRAYIREIMDEKYSAKYTRIVAMLVESLAIVSSFCVFFLVAYIVESPTLVMMPYILTQVQVIGPLLLMYRVMSGRAWASHVTPSLRSLPTAGEENNSPRHW